MASGRCVGRGRSGEVGTAWAGDRGGVRAAGHRPDTGYQFAYAEGSRPVDRVNVARVLRFMNNSVDRGRPWPEPHLVSGVRPAARGTHGRRARPRAARPGVGRVTGNAYSASNPEPGNTYLTSINVNTGDIAQGPTLTKAGSTLTTSGGDLEGHLREGARGGPGRSKQDELRACAPIQQPAGPFVDGLQTESLGVETPRPVQVQGGKPGRHTCPGQNVPVVCVHVSTVP